MRTLSLASVSLLALTLTACTVMPTGPSVTVLPGSTKSFEQFRYDDVSCRHYAQVQVGGANEAINQSTVGSAVVGTAVGALAGLDVQPVETAHRADAQPVDLDRAVRHALHDIARFGLRGALRHVEDCRRAGRRRRLDVDHEAAGGRGREAGHHRVIGDGIDARPRRHRLRRLDGLAAQLVDGRTRCGGERKKSGNHHMLEHHSPPETGLFYSP